MADPLRHELKFSTDASNAIGMELFAEVLIDWSRALKAALPGLVDELGLDVEQKEEILAAVEPVTSAPRPGSLRAAYGYGYRADEELRKADENLFVRTETLEGLVDAFESGVSATIRDAQPPNWMTGYIARSVLQACTHAEKRGVSVSLPYSGDIRLSAETAKESLMGFLDRDSGGTESEFEVVGLVTSVNIAASELRLKSEKHGQLRVAFRTGDRELVCDTMRDQALARLSVQARLSSDGALSHAKLRQLEPLSTDRNYVAQFEALWGSARDIFEGVPRDERGLPDPDAPKN